MILVFLGFEFPWELSPLFLYCACLAVVFWKYITYLVSQLERNFAYLQIPPVSPISDI